MIRYAITDGARFGRDAAARRGGLLKDAARWADAGVEFVQLREKDLGEEELLELAAAMMRIFRESGGGTRLLVNGRVDVAVAAGADGVHLTAASGEMNAAKVRASFPREVVVSVSCHSVEEARRKNDADLILFGPVFEKRVGGDVVVEGVGLEALREACAVAGEAKVLALGGVAAENLQRCVDAGAAGVAAIRMFSE